MDFPNQAQRHVFDLSSTSQTVNNDANNHNPQKVYRFICADSEMESEQQRACNVSGQQAEQNLTALMPPPTHPPIASNVLTNLSPRASGMKYAASSSLDMISPSKEGEISMEFSPSVKKYCKRSHPPSALLNSPKTPDRQKAVSSTFSDVFNSEQVEEKHVDSKDTEIQPGHLFISSPDSPSSEYTAMMDSIKVPNEECGEEDFLKRQKKPSIRRCRSLEMRKHLLDVSNTPPNAYSKRSLFKRPGKLEVKSDKYGKRLKDSASQVPDDSSGASFSNVSPGNSDLEGERIKLAVDALQSPDLVADGTRLYCLPVIAGYFRDLKNIHHQTMVDVLTCKYNSFFDKLTIIDCRYPYEYEGGHIKSAINIYTDQDLVDFLNREVEIVSQTAHKHILIFHCEFSSKRGPSLLRLLRKCDRKLNILRYPRLTFPEVYCLFGGYKEFYLNHPEFCEPPSYVTMFDEQYANDLRLFRAKAKSWTAGEEFK